MTRAHTLCLILALTALPGAALAESAKAEKPPAMRHMRVMAPDAPAHKEQAEKAIVAPVPETPAPAPATPVAEIPVRKPLTPAEALRKPEDLKVWAQTAETVIVTSDKAINDTIKIVEADPGAVPPQALLFLARNLASKDRMEEAAIYFYVAQIRLSFDMSRWPPRLNPEQVKALLAEQKKSADQQMDLPAPELENPHQNMAALATQIGHPITRWMVADADRAQTVLGKVKAWDEGTPYAYLPGYALPEAVPFKDWEKLLTRTRTNFYAQTEQILLVLKQGK